MLGYVTIGAKDGEASGKFYDAFFGGFGNVAVVFEVAPVTGYGFGKGGTFSQTRWDFAAVTSP